MHTLWLVALLQKTLCTIFACTDSSVLPTCLLLLSVVSISHVTDTWADAKAILLKQNISDEAGKCDGFSHCLLGNGNLILI